MCLYPPEIKRSLLAGGGIGGMEAAIEAAAKGHRVILCEKSGELGGALKCEKNVPFKTKIRDYIAYQIKHLEKSGAEIRLNTPVTPKLADEALSRRHNSCSRGCPPYAGYTWNTGRKCIHCRGDI